MLDPFSGKPTLIQGAALPDECSQHTLVKYYELRLEGIDRLCAAAAECGIRTDTERHLLLLREEDVSLLEREGGAWRDLYIAIKDLRPLLPILPLEKFGFPEDAENPFEETNPRMRQIGVGMEAWVFQAARGSIYKFFLPSITDGIGATFRFTLDNDHVLHVAACRGNYRDLLKKLMLLNMIGGMPTELIGITPEGILVSKQTRGALLPSRTEPSILSSSPLVPIPSRWHQCDRIEPRLVFAGQHPWLVADLHERNVARDECGALRIIDFVAAPFPEYLQEGASWMRPWLEKVRCDPAASLIDDFLDEEL